MARPLKTDWFTWFTSLPASTLLFVCLFVPQFHDCNGHDKDAFDTSTAPMMIALAVIGFLPLVWRWIPKAAEHEDLAGLCGALIAIAFIAFFPVVGLFSTWYQGAYVTWAAAWMELAAMVTWTTAATTRKAVQMPPRAIPIRSRVRSTLTDHEE
jgi:hypothetical protein